MVLSVWYKIQKEHVVIFTILLGSLILFNYFDGEFNYTGLAYREINKNEITGYGFFDSIKSFFQVFQIKKSAIGKKSLPIGDKETTLIIDSCREIKNSGDYILNKDITSVKSYTCIDIHDVNDIKLNCNNHVIFGNISVSINKVKNFEIKNCKFKNIYEINTIYIRDSYDGVIKENSIENYYLSLDHTQNINIINNKLSILEQKYSKSNTIQNNIFNPPRLSLSGVVISVFGFNNKIIRNQIDGKSDGNFSNKIGFDDGIMLQDENMSLVKDNIINNHWDCGIETAGFISNSKIINNKIKNAGYCGIGGWYWSSWLNNIVSNNIIDDAPTLFQFYRYYGLRDKETNVYFKDNLFDNNKLINPRIQINPVDSRIPPSSYFDFHPASGIKANLYIIKDNKLKNNDFSTVLTSPYFYPVDTDAIIDDGGNICKTSTEKDYPLKCVSSSPTTTISKIKKFKDSPI